MKFESEKEELIYYWMKVKYMKENGDNEGYLFYLKKAKDLLKKIEEKEDKVGDNHEF